MISYIIFRELLILTNTRDTEIHYTLVLTYASVLKNRVENQSKTTLHQNFTSLAM
jgi:hypothetical protein